MVGLILIVGPTRRHQADQLAAQHDLELIAGLQAQPGGLGIAHHQLAVELDLGGIAEVRPGFPLLPLLQVPKCIPFASSSTPQKAVRFSRSMPSFLVLT